MTFATTPRTRSVPSPAVLEGLTRLHPFVLLANERGEISWVSERLRRQLDKSYRAGGPGDTTSDGTAGKLQTDAVRLLNDLLARLPNPGQLAELVHDLRTHGEAQQLIDVGGGTDLPDRVEANAFRVKAESRSVPYYIVIARGVTSPTVEGRKAAETADLLAGILDASTDGVIAADHNGFVTYANPAVRALLGKSPLELMGKPLAFLLPDASQFGAMLQRLGRDGGLEGDDEMERSDEGGRTSWLSVSIRPLRLPDGTTKGIVAYLRDTTSRRRRQEELRGKNRELESYVDTVAHDLRSPLVSLLGFTRLLRQDYATLLDETGHHFVDRIEQAGRTMEVLIHDLLELSRIRSPGEVPSFTDPRAVLQRLQAELKLRLEEQSVELALPDEPPMLRIDSTRLYQIFSNLIGNALSHMGPCESPRIEVSIVERGDHHVICVADNGRGIPAEEHEGVFEAFKTSKRRKKSGSRSAGIGLAIVKKIAETHGGRVLLESAPERGARFSVELPNR